MLMLLWAIDQNSIEALPSPFWTVYYGDPLCCKSHSASASNSIGDINLLTRPNNAPTGKFPGGIPKRAVDNETAGDTENEARLVQNSVVHLGICLVWRIAKF